MQRQDCVPVAIGSRDIVLPALDACEQGGSAPPGHVVARTEIAFVAGRALWGFQPLCHVVNTAVGIVRAFSRSCALCSFRFHYDLELVPGLVEARTPRPAEIAE